MYRIAILLFVLLWAVPSQAGTKYDLAYYLGLVTSSGGSTLTDGVWLANGNTEAEEDLTDGIDSHTLENAHVAHTDGTYALLTWYRYEPGEGWILNNTRIFVVGDNYIEYCGAYLQESGMTIIPEKRMRLPRYMEVGEITSISEPGVMQSGSDSVDTTLYMSIFIQKDGITLESPEVPSSVSDCLRVKFDEGTSMNVNSFVYILGPGRGELRYSHLNYYPLSLSDSTALGETSFYLGQDVLQFGTSASFLINYNDTTYTTAGELAGIETDIENMSIPTEHVSAASGAAVVIPMF